jgi:hypothetical protein
LRPQRGWFSSLSGLKRKVRARQRRKLHSAARVVPQSTEEAFAPDSRAGLLERAVSGATKRSLGRSLEPHNVPGW